MSTQVLTNASVVINSVDLSDHVKSVTVQDGADMLEDSAMGATYHTMKAGLKVGKITVAFHQDRASSKVDATIAPLVGASTSYSVVVKAVNTTVGPTNPTWTITQAQISGDYTGVGGSVGQLEETSVTFVPGSGGTLTRATT
jgi:hypothetical protein